MSLLKKLTLRTRQGAAPRERGISVCRKRIAQDNVPGAASLALSDSGRKSNTSPRVPRIQGACSPNSSPRRVPHKGSGQEKSNTRDDLLPPTMEGSRPKTHAQVKLQQAATKSIYSLSAKTPDRRAKVHGSSSHQEYESNSLAKNGNRRNSQKYYSRPDQTILVFDWDDTLFPTSWLRNDMSVHWRYPLEEQVGTLRESEVRKVRDKLNNFQVEVLRVLTQAMHLGHVVIVTLARPPWVQLSCDNFFPYVGRFLQKHKINIVYAQYLEARGSQVKEYNKQAFANNDYRFWVHKKQQAMLQEISRFYGHNKSSWKNILSFGDSDFERYAMHGSLDDYAAHNAKGTHHGPYAGAGRERQPVLSHSKTRRGINKDPLAVSGYIGTHYRRCRAKTVKMFESPTIEDLSTEMIMIYKWMPYLVNLDAGFDVDMEDNDSLHAAHALLIGDVRK